MRIIQLYLCILAVFLLQACKNNPENFDRRSICYWKTTFKPDSTRNKLLGELNVRHLYIRYFDIDWNPVEREVRPVSTIQMEEVPGVAFTPSIFITSNAMRHIDENQVEILAARIVKRVDMVNEAVRSIPFYPEETDSLRSLLKNRYNEILIDYDWTESTKGTYFLLLKEIKKLLPDKKVSATLRLWQYKYRSKAGIPPIDRCLLMCYHTGNPKDYQNENSIATIKDVKAYSVGKSYPIALDFALPVFNWGILYRNKVFAGLLGTVDAGQLRTDTAYYEETAPMRFRLKQDKSDAGHLLRTDDEIKVEQVSVSDMNKLIRLLTSKFHPEPGSRLTLFSYDTLYIRQYGSENINIFYESF